LTRRNDRRLFARGVALVLTAAGLTACTDAAGYDLDYILSIAPFVSTMRTSVSYDPNAMPRLPAPGTVPVSSPNGELLPPFTQAQLDSVGAALTSPLEPTAEVLERGAVVYDNQCYVCHGEGGQGNGPVIGAGRFPLGPAVNGAATAARSDGYLYGVIRVGRGLMPAYGERIAHNDRWAVVAYLRQLQGQTGTATPAQPAPAAAAPPAVAEADNAAGQG
jgi:mono/diheme cytochrome c family protein